MMLAGDLINIEAGNTESAYFNATAAYYGWTNEQLYTFLVAMRQHVTYSLLGGLTKTYTVG